MGTRLSEPATSRWKFKTETVTAGDNSVVVRGLTVGERTQFIQAGKEHRAAKGLPEELAKSAALSALLVRSGITPAMSEDEVAAMPPELFDKAADVIMQLSGLRDGPAEKKAADPAAH